MVHNSLPLDLLPAEQRILDADLKGARIVIGQGELPDEPDAQNEVRSSFLRSLLAAELVDHKVRPGGMRLRGAFVSGALDLHGLNIPFDLSFSNCRFEKTLSAVNARFGGFYLSKCFLPGFVADQARFDGPLFIREETYIEGELSLPGVLIAGDFQLCGARLKGGMTASLFANGITIQGSAYIGDFPYSPKSTELTADAPIYMMSASVARDLYIRNASLTGPGGQNLEQQPEDPDAGSPAALSLARSTIGGAFYAKSLQVSGGILNFAGLSAKRLNDEPSGVDVNYRLRLDGFEYTAFAQHTDISVESRLDWLARRPAEVSF